MLGVGKCRRPWFLRPERPKIAIAPRVMTAPATAGEAGGFGPFNPEHVGPDTRCISYLHFRAWLPAARPVSRRSRHVPAFAASLTLALDHVRSPNGQTSSRHKSPRILPTQNPPQTPSRFTIPTGLLQSFSAGTTTSPSLIWPFRSHFLFPLSMFPSKYGTLHVISTCKSSPGLRPKQRVVLGIALLA